MKKLLFSAFFLSYTVVFSQQPPGTEIYLLDLTIKDSGLTLSNPQNITNHPGYDNQPFFHPDKSIIYYTSANEKGQTDIHFFNYKSTETKTLTTTNEREYSPTVTPDKKYISCIVQRDNGTQDLVKYSLKGGTPVVLINTLTVGYHAWRSDSSVLVFALGQPNTLQAVNIEKGKNTWIADSIGRSIHRIPESNLISFISKSSDKVWYIKTLDSNNTISLITETLPGREDLGWTPDKKIIMSDGKNLFYYDTQNSSGWQQIESSSFTPTGTISRLAVNSKGNKIAIVVNE